MELNLPTPVTFLCCQKIQQDVLSKNYDLRGVFQGFQVPGYPFGAEFMTFCRLRYDKTGSFRIDTSLYDDKGTKVSDSEPRQLEFGESPVLDLLTGWRVVFPAPGTYSFRVFCNNINIGSYPVFCR
jgi:hypothetical protein